VESVMSGRRDSSTMQRSPGDRRSGSSDGPRHNALQRDEFRGRLRRSLDSRDRRQPGFPVASTIAQAVILDGHNFGHTPRIWACGFHGRGWQGALCMVPEEGIEPTLPVKGTGF